MYFSYDIKKIIINIYVHLMIMNKNLYLKKNL